MAIKFASAREKNRFKAKLMSAALRGLERSKKTKKKKSGRRTKTTAE